MDARYSSLHPITRLRLKHSPPLTTEEVARKAKLHRTSLSKVEYGHRDHPGFDVARQLADAFPEDLDLKTLADWHWTERAKKQARSFLAQIENGRHRRGRAKSADRRRQSS